MWDNQQSKTPDLNAMKVRIALLEDEKEEEKTMVAMIERFFQETGHGYEIATFSDSHEFLKLNFELCDLVLLDIILSEKNNGIDVAKEIRKTNKNIAIMFITKTAQFAIDGYNVDALDYILKPLSYYAFALKLKKALHYLENTQNRDIVLRTTDGIVRLKEDDIIYFEVIRHYLYVHSKDKVYKARGTMKEVTNATSRKFARSGNIFLVNLRHVTEIRKQEIVCGNNVIPLTKIYKDSFLKAFGAYTNKVDS